VADTVVVTAATSAAGTSLTGMAVIGMAIAVVAGVRASDSMGPIMATAMVVVISATTSITAAIIRIATTDETLDSGPDRGRFRMQAYVRSVTRKRRFRIRVGERRSGYLCSDARSENSQVS
jgi:hypothetical protein